MRYFALCIALLLMGAMVFGLAGCGGGGGSSNTRTGTLSTDDGVVWIEWLDVYSYYDEWGCIAKSTGTTTVDLESDDFDTYLVICDSDGDVIAYDDDSGTGTDSSVSFTVYEGEAYYAFAASRFDYETGHYTIRFSSNLRSISQTTSGSVGTKATPKALKSTTAKATPKTEHFTPVK